MRAMMVGLLMAVVLASGCAPDPVAAPVSAPEQAAPTSPPACVVNVTAPERYARTLQRNDQPGIDCFTGYWDGVFEFRFAHGWGLSLDVPRWLNASGSTIDLEAGSLGLLYQDDTSDGCTNWTGTLKWTDGPSWRVELDATCVDGAVVRVAGVWAGTG